MHPDAWNLSPFVFSLRYFYFQKYGNLPLELFTIYLSLTIKPPTSPEIRSKINVTDPWPEFYEKNKFSYNYTLAEPTEEQIIETVELEDNKTATALNISDSEFRETHDWYN